MSEPRTAVITGANRGIGREIARQLHAYGFQVILAGRNMPDLNGLCKELGERATPFRVDVTNDESVELFGNFMKENFPKVDVLINNAGVMGSKPMLDFDLQELDAVMRTNFMGPISLVAELMPLLQKSEDARIINISSIMGSKDYLVAGSAAYRLSKWALNGFVIQLANELRDTDIKVFAVHPGWVQTDMGGQGATRSVQEGADTPVWLATTDVHELETGWFYFDRKKIPY